MITKPKDECRPHAPPCNKAARSGVGLTYSADLVTAQDVGLGRLEVVLRPFLVKTPGLFLYFPARMQRQPKLRAFIDVAIATLKPHHDSS
jgi:DNA-binding transcriptional LysR family regulator